MDGTSAQEAPGHEVVHRWARRWKSAARHHRIDLQHFRDWRLNELQTYLAENRRLHGELEMLAWELARYREYRRRAISLDWTPEIIAAAKDGQKWLFRMELDGSFADKDAPKISLATALSAEQYSEVMRFCNGVRGAPSSS